MIPIRLSITTNITTTYAFWRTRSTIVALALLASVVLGLTLEAGMAHAASFTVTNTRDSGPGSLRQAVLDANANNNPGARDAVAFDIPAATDPGCDAGGVCTISPTTVLPEIRQAVSIDGYTQQGAKANTLATGNNAELKIELSGARFSRSPRAIKISAPNSVLRGLVINRWNKEPGVVVSGSDASGNRIEGNYIGIDASGQEALGNKYGVILSRAPDNVVGGTSPGARNVISGNQDVGLYISDLDASGNRIEGNYIGTDASGRERLRNSTGVFFFSAPNNAVGGTAAGARNVISGNATGVSVYGETGAGGNRIEGNYIGTDASGQEELGNRFDGVEIASELDCVVGGSTASAANTIAFNGDDGVYVDGGRVSTGDSILRNSIFDNGGLGINLDSSRGDANVVTPNDPLDSDNGPNGLQNYPTITSAITTGEQTTIRGTLNSNPNQPFALRFFDSPTADPSGFGEGKTYLGQSIVSTNASGNASFALTIDAPLRVGHVVSATATNRVSKDTSEFSRAVEVEDGIPPTVVSTNPRDGATGVLAAVNVSATFSEQMKASTINTTTFKLFRKVGTTDQRVAAVVSYDVAQKRATLNPNANLVPGGRYEAQVTTGVQDLAGNGLAQRKDFTFTVRR